MAVAVTALSLGCVQPPVPATAQVRLPFTVTWVDWSEEALARQRKAYRAEAASHEVLFCVEKWRLDTPGSGYRHIVIERTRREVSGEPHRIPDASPKCRNKKGEPLPTIHTHSDGNCQPSPQDLTAIAERGAQFDGIQCGDNYFVWAFAWQIKAISTWVYLSKPIAQPSTSTR